MTQPPADGDGGVVDPLAGAAEVRQQQRMELIEVQIAKLWELFTRAGRLDVSVDSLRDEVKFAASMWQQIQSNDETLQATRSEVHAVQAAQQGKADRKIVRRAILVVAASAVVLVAGIGYVSREASEVRGIAHMACVASNAIVQVSITREAELAQTDVPGTRATHARSAAALSQQLRQCP